MKKGVTVPEVTVEDGGVDLEKMMDGFTDFCLSYPQEIAAFLVAITVAWFLRRVLGNRLASGMFLVAITAIIMYAAVK